jgi:rubredoxin
MRHVERFGERPWRKRAGNAIARTVRSPRILVQSPFQPSLSMAETAQTSKTWMCLICGFIYDEAAGLPDEGIAPGTRWEDVPMNWTCPECGARKDDFEMVEI